LEDLPQHFKSFSVPPLGTFRTSRATGSILVFFEEKLASEVGRKVEFVVFPRREASTVP
jgi:hypothetical protein